MYNFISQESNELATSQNHRDTRFVYDDEVQSYKKFIYAEHIAHSASKLNWIGRAFALLLR